MLRTTIRAALLLVGVLISTSHAQPQDPRADAFLFAIAFFDPGHTRGISPEGPEMAYMAGALEAAKQVEPHLRSISNRLYSVPVCTCHMTGIDQMVNETQALQITVRVDPYSRRSGNASLNSRTLTPTSVIELAERTAGNWSKTRRTEENDLSKRSVTYYCNDGTTNNVDTNSIDYRLRSEGYVCAILETSESKHFEYANLYLVRRDIGDMDYFARMLMLDDSLKSVFEPFEPRKLSGSMIGDGNWIRLERSRTPGEFGTPLTFKFSMGWGDCPSGCLERHNWLVRVAPSRSRGDNSWKFRAELVSEDGPAVPRGAGCQ